MRTLRPTPVRSLAHSYHRAKCLMVGDDPHSRTGCIVAAARAARRECSTLTIRSLRYGLPRYGLGQATSAERRAGALWSKRSNQEPSASPRSRGAQFARPTRKVSSCCSSGRSLWALMVIRDLLPGRAARPNTRRSSRRRLGTQGCNAWPDRVSWCLVSGIGRVCARDARGSLLSGCMRCDRAEEYESYVDDPTTLEAIQSLHDPRPSFGGGCGAPRYGLALVGCNQLPSAPRVASCSTPMDPPPSARERRSQRARAPCGGLALSLRALACMRLPV